MTSTREFTPSRAGTSRRTLLKAAGTGVLGAAAFGSTMATAGPVGATVDVIVVGAGFAGLTAARELVRSGKSVAVLEARDRVGGRTKMGQIAGHAIDLGGMWVGPDQTHLLAMGNEYGVKRYVSPIAGKNVTEINGVIRQGERDNLALDGKALAELGRLIPEIDVLTAAVLLDQPWNTPNAQQLDAKTFQSWTEELTDNADVRRLLRAVAAGVFASDAAAFSALFFSFYVRSSGRLQPLMAVGDGAQKWLYHGGVHQIARKIAGDLGERLVLNAPVELIRQDQLGVEVTAAGRVFKAKRVIVTVPPALCARIRFSPSLPAGREKLSQRYPMGSVIKFWVAYRRPFWRDAGLNGFAFAESPMGLTFDATPDGADVGLIAGFFEGEHAVEWGPRGPDARRALVTKELTRLFGAGGSDVIDYIDNDWPSEEWSRGCYGGIATPGTLSLLGSALRAPVGRIHWSGTETALESTGYIDGAIRSGKRAAADAMATL